ncbi:40S ribosomal protein S17 [Artemisia annua]|uniref:40S ribosomal protein S17 n=1 Tax=Artemisia annua TaxID=35608 RepID=A0A2U1M1F8_ARTAN|nr:40S ribosomal protein S17 [Artemisia annua]
MVGGCEEDSLIFSCEEPPIFGSYIGGYCGYYCGEMNGGFWVSTHLMKRIQKGPVRGISLKLQEEERERRMDFVPEESAIKVDRIEVDKETIEMLAMLGMAELPGVVVKEEDQSADCNLCGGWEFHISGSISSSRQFCDNI